MSVGRYFMCLALVCASAIMPYGTVFLGGAALLALDDLSTAIRERRKS